MTDQPELPVEYLGARELRGPLMVVQGVAGVGWDEFAVIRDGDSVRHGLVLEVHEDLAVVQVLEGTQDLDPADLRISFSGEPLHIPVGPGLVGPHVQRPRRAARRRSTGHRRPLGAGCRSAPQPDPS